MLVLERLYLEHKIFRVLDVIVEDLLKSVASAEVGLRAVQFQIV